MIFKQLAQYGKQIRINIFGCFCQYHVWIDADIKLMESVIQNLVDNAVKNTSPNESIKVALTVQGKDLVFTIENSGNPLEPNLINWINSRETDVVQYTDRPAKSGLGLVIVKRILRLHNSYLVASSKSENINVFSFSLPVYEPNLKKGELS